MIRILSIFLFFSATALALPGQPTFLQVGTLSCAARMYTPIQLQVWCFSDPALKVIQINLLCDISDNGFIVQTRDINDVATGSSIHWEFLPDVIPNPIIVSWEATITKFGVVGPKLTGIL
jgi:hypothetical protein